MPNDTLQRVSAWLKMLDNVRHDLVPLYTGDYEFLAKIACVPYERIIKSKDGTPRVFFVDRKKAIKLLKERYGFFTRQEAEAELKEAAKDGTDI